MVYVLEHNTLKSKQYFSIFLERETETETEVYVYLCGKRAMLFPVSSRETCHSYGLNATVLHRRHTHILSDSLMLCICMCVLMCAHFCVFV